MIPEPTIPAVARTRGAHVLELDGLRAIAILLVLGAHVFFTPPATEASRAFLPGPLATLIAHGWLGVDLFFVLSGFLITGILIETKALGAGTYFRRFYIRRAARILPLYFLVLLVLFIVERGHNGGYFALCAMFAANLSDAFHVRIPDSAGPYWSLAVEEQFYLVWPWLVLWFDTKRLAWLTVAIVVVEPILRFGADPGQLSLTWFRTDGLAIGAFIAIWFSHWDGDRASARRLGLALAGIAVAVTLAGIPFGVLHDGLASRGLRITQAILLFGSALTFAVAFSGRRELAFLRGRFTAVTALLSYCLYLIHKPVVSAVARLWPHLPFAEHTGAEGTLVVRILCALAIAYGLAAASYRLLERPIVRFAQKL